MQLLHTPIAISNSYLGIYKFANVYLAVSNDDVQCDVFEMLPAATLNYFSGTAWKGT